MIDKNNPTIKKQIEIFRQMVNTPREDIDRMFDSGMFNSITEGYLIAALESHGESKETILEVVSCFRSSLDDMRAAEAQEKLKQL